MESKGCTQTLSLRIVMISSNRSDQGSSSTNNRSTKYSTISKSDPAYLEEKLNVIADELIGDGINCGASKPYISVTWPPENPMSWRYSEIFQHETALQHFAGHQHRIINTYVPWQPRPETNNSDNSPTSTSNSKNPAIADEESSEDEDDCEERLERVRQRYRRMTEKVVAEVRVTKNIAYEKLQWLYEGRFTVYRLLSSPHFIVPRPTEFTSEQYIFRDDPGWYSSTVPDHVTDGLSLMRFILSDKSLNYRHQQCVLPLRARDDPCYRGWEYTIHPTGTVTYNTAAERWPDPIIDWLKKHLPKHILDKLDPVFIETYDRASMTVFLSGGDLPKYVPEGNRPFVWPLCGHLACSNPGHYAYLGWETEMKFQAGDLKPEQMQYGYFFNQKKGCVRIRDVFLPMCTRRTRCTVNIQEDNPPLCSHEPRCITCARDRHNTCGNWEERFEFYLTFELSGPEGRKIRHQVNQVARDRYNMEYNTRDTENLHTEEQRNDKKQQLLDTKKQANPQYHPLYMPSDIVFRAFSSVGPIGYENPTTTLLVRWTEWENSGGILPIWFTHNLGQGCSLLGCGITDEDASGFLEGTDAVPAENDTTEELIHKYEVANERLKRLNKQLSKPAANKGGRPSKCRKKKEEVQEPSDETKTLEKLLGTTREMLKKALGRDKATLVASISEDRKKLANRLKELKSKVKLTIPDETEVRVKIKALDNKIEALEKEDKP